MAGARPDSQDIRVFKGAFEIVSLIGTIDKSGKSHLHMSFSDANGNVTGGHVKEGCIIHTTVELTLVSNNSLLFERKNDEATGFDELYVEDIA